MHEIPTELMTAIEHLAIIYRRSGEFLDERVLILYKAVMQQNANSGISFDQAAHALFAAYVAEHVSKIKQISDIQGLGNYMHAAPHSWGRLPEQYYTKIQTEIFARLSILKSQRRIYRMDSDERQKYISSNCVDGSGIFAKQIQDFVKVALDAWLVSNAHNLNKAGIGLSAWLYAISVSTSNYLQLNSRRITPEYSFNVELNNHVRQRLISEQKKYVTSLAQLDTVDQKYLLEKRRKSIKDLHNRYLTESNYNCEHLANLYACQDEVGKVLKAMRKTEILRFAQDDSTVKINTTPALKAQALKYF